MEHEQLKSIVESLLFATDEPLTVPRFTEVLEGVDKADLMSVLQDLQADYEGQKRGFRLTEVAGGFQLRTAKENAEWVKRLQEGKPARISRATLETLAIIAYRQPITKAEIETIRGVDVSGVISTLLEKHLIRIVARKDVPGRPFLYGTTREFLEIFNLKDLTHLPTLKDMEQITLPMPPESETEEPQETREE